MYILELPLLPCERFNNILSQGLLLKTRHILYSFLSDTNRNLLPQCDSSELWTVPQKLDKKRISMNAVQLIRGYYISEIDNSSPRPSISLLFGRKSVLYCCFFGGKSVLTHSVIASSILVPYTNSLKYHASLGTSHKVSDNNFSSPYNNSPVVRLGSCCLYIRCNTSKKEYYLPFVLEYFIQFACI